MLDPAKPDHGCYTNDRLSDLTNSVWHVLTAKPLIFLEFGADAKSGFHAGANPQKFSQEFQAESYRQTLAVADKLPMLRGLSLWTLKDFRSPRGQNRDFQMGWNHKGLILETGQHKQVVDVPARSYIVKASAANR
jgi:beta-glucuronidase